MHCDLQLDNGFTTNPADCFYIGHCKHTPPCGDDFQSRRMTPFLLPRMFLFNPKAFVTGLQARFAGRSFPLPFLPALAVAVG